MLKLKVALPSTTNKLDIAFTRVSAVEIVKANPSIIINNDSSLIWSFNSKLKNPRSGLIVGSTEKETIPIKPIKKTIGTIIKKEITKLFLSILLFLAA